MRLSLLANGHIDEEYLLLEDANDLLLWYEEMGRTIPRSKWAAESIMAVAQAANEAVF